MYDLGNDGYHGAHAPTAARCITVASRGCNLGGDFSWAKDLLVLTRAFRDFLSALADSDLPSVVRVREAVRVFNEYLGQSPSELLVFWQRGDKQIRFGRCPRPESPSLSSFIAAWIADYLENHLAHVSFGVCGECGRFFARERRDRAFCSKTCQNRVAYKRKKILESNALMQVNIPPDDACDIAAGLWMHHPRYGIGLVESVTTSGGGAMLASLSEVPRRPEDAVRYRSMLSRRVAVHARFLHGVRTLGYADLFEGQKREDQLPTFYELKSGETLAELL